MVKITKKFRIADVAQQLIGGILLAGPFVVTEEVWRLGNNLHFIQFIGIIIFNSLIGYIALYKADKTRNVEVEQDIIGVPIRLISLVLISYFSVFLLVLLFSPQNTFEIGFYGTVNSISICSIFSLVGAATSDSIF